MPQVDTYLVFDGTCAEAMRFYERALDGKLEILMTHAGSPMAEHVSPANADRINRFTRTPTAFPKARL